MVLLLLHQKDMKKVLDLVMLPDALLFGQIENLAQK